MDNASLQLIESKAYKYLKSIVESDESNWEEEKACAKSIISSYAHHDMAKIVANSLDKHGYILNGSSNLNDDALWKTFWELTIFIPIINSWARNSFYRCIKEIVDTFCEGDVAIDALLQKDLIITDPRRN